MPEVEFQRSFCFCELLWLEVVLSLRPCARLVSGLLDLVSAVSGGCCCCLFLGLSLSVSDCRCDGGGFSDRVLSLGDHNIPYALGLLRHVRLGQVEVPLSHVLHGFHDGVLSVERHVHVQLCANACIGRTFGLRDDLGLVLDHLRPLGQGLHVLVPARVGNHVSCSDVPACRESW